MANGWLKNLWGEADDEVEKDSGIKPLALSKLRRRCDTSGWEFNTSQDAPSSSKLLGQDRALGAIDFAANMGRPGYNVYVVSTDDGGYEQAITDHLKSIAGDMPTPADWVYVYNFEEPRHPKALKLKPGQGGRFKEAVEQAVLKLRGLLPAIFASDEYRARVDRITREASEAIDALQRRVDAAGMAIVSTEDGGYIILPLRDGQPMSEVEIAALDPSERHRLEMIAADLQEELDETVAKLPEWQQRVHECIEDLNQDVCLKAIDQAFETLIASFSGSEQINEYLKALVGDILDNVDEFADDEVRAEALSQFAGKRDPLHRYKVIVVSSSDAGIGGPVVVESHPTYGRLTGSVQSAHDIASPSYDLTSITAGALHRAAGGFLVLDVEELLQLPMAWEVLKRTLRTGEITIDQPGEWFGEYGLETMAPEPIPLSCKVVLLGDRYLQYRLNILDTEFSDHFKVLADLNEEMDRSEKADETFARILSEIAREEDMRPFSASALGHLVEESSRLAEDAEKLALALTPMKDIMAEADHCASLNGNSLVGVDDIDHALRLRDERYAQFKERSQEFILREFVKIETKGMKVGQINGLVVTGLDHAFGRPSRITARARMGAADQPIIRQVVDIQSEVELSGATHSKGVLILSGFLQSRFSPDQPLSLSATLVFEQSYSFIDGDSASCAELCALLSAIGDIPLRQDVAITGAISQHGEVQAIGGVNDKIEGFFDICKARGLTGKQGVIIPESNIKDLMLRQEILEAVRHDHFAIWAIETVDDALEILTRMPAGVRESKGRFTAGSVNRSVEDRLEAFEEARRKSNRPWKRKKMAS